MHATAPVFTHAHAEPGTSWLTITVTMEMHTAATRNHIARALVLTFLLAWAVDGVCVGADPTGGRALIRVNFASVRAPDLRDPPNLAVSTASLIPATAWFWRCYYKCSLPVGRLQYFAIREYLPSPAASST